MIEHDLVKSRKEGVVLGQALQKELVLWHHVVDNHLFEDKYLFFRLTSQKDDDDENDGGAAGQQDSTRRRIGNDGDILTFGDDESDDNFTVSSISMSNYDFNSSISNNFRFEVF